MDSQPKRWADWWAELASIDQIGRLTPGQFKGLFAAYLVLAESEPAPGIPLDTKAGKTLRTLVEEPFLGSVPEPEAYERGFIEQAHKHALAVIVGLLDGRGWSAPSGPVQPQPAPLVSWRLDEGNVVRVVPLWGQGAPLHLQRLYDTLRPGKPFLYARCPQCRRIFARSGRQIRCSYVCTRTALEQQRTGTEKRKAQVRAAVKKHRDRNAKGKSRKGGR